MSAGLLLLYWNLLVGTFRSIIHTPKKLPGGKARAANFSTSTIVNLNNFAKALIFLVIGKELPSGNAAVILSQDLVKSSGITQTQFVWMKTTISKISIPSCPHFKEVGQIQDASLQISENQAFIPPSSIIDATLQFVLFQENSCSFWSEATFWSADNQDK